MSSPRRALIVIDPQIVYFTGPLPIQHPPREASVQRIGEAIATAERLGIPVVVVQHSAAEGARVFDPASAEFDLHDSLARRHTGSWKRVVKNFSSIFPETGLQEWLVENDIDTITLVGYMTNNCVLATAADAETRGVTVEVLSDATGAIDIVNAAGAADAETVHTTLMAILHANWAAVASSADWAAAMEAGASLPKGSLVESAAAGAGQS